MNRLWARLALSYGLFVILLTIVEVLLAGTFLFVASVLHPSYITPITWVYDILARIFGPWVYHPTLYRSSLLFGTLLVGLLGAGGLSVWIGSAYARRLTLPLTRLSDHLEQLDEGGSGQTLPVDGADEFAALARSYNKLVRRLAASEESRARADQSRRDLIANLSHDIRMPLTSLKGFAEALADEVDPGPDARRHYAQVIGRRAAELDGLLSDLLDLSRLQTLPEANFVRCDLAEIIREAVIPSAQELPASGIDLEVDLPDEPVFVRADEGLVRRAVENLVQNAVGHATGATCVEVRLRMDSGDAVIEVLDDGPGIPQDLLPRVFDRYYRGTSSTNKTNGSGLGLAIVREIARVHGGEASAENRLTGGAQFTIRLPYTANSEPS